MISALLWILVPVILLIVVTLRDGSNYISAFTVVGLGVVFYLLNVVLMAYFLRRRAPGSISHGTWESTAGTGGVPRWVSKIGMLGVGLLLSGIVIALLLLLGIAGKNENAVLGLFELHRVPAKP